MTLLIAGGHADPNLTILGEAANSKGLELLDLRVGSESVPRFDWSIDRNELSVDGKLVSPVGAFVRHDVFGSMQDPRPEVSTCALGWYTSVQGWLLANPQVRTFNREMSQVASAKPAALNLAREVGLAIPSTRIANEESVLLALDPAANIAKPVNGGGYCLLLGEALGQTGFRSGVAAIPAIVQPKLIAPEIRIYVIGTESFAFELRSPALDYRIDQNVDVQEVPVPEVSVLLREMMERLKMDFGAADFKTDPVTGELVFLELNTSPMFARFDYVAQGRLSLAILDALLA